MPKGKKSTPGRPKRNKAKKNEDFVSFEEFSLPQEVSNVNTREPEGSMNDLAAVLKRIEQTNTTILHRLQRLEQSSAIVASPGTSPVRIPQVLAQPATADTSNTASDLVLPHTRRRPPVRAQMENFRH